MPADIHDALHRFQRWWPNYIVIWVTLFEIGEIVPECLRWSVNVIGALTDCPERQAAQGSAIWASCSMTLFSPRNTAPPAETVSRISRQSSSRSVRALSTQSGLATTAES